MQRLVAADHVTEHRRPERDERQLAVLRRDERRRRQQRHVAAAEVDDLQQESLEHHQDQQTEEDHGVQDQRADAPLAPGECEQVARAWHHQRLI